MYINHLNSGVHTYYYETKQNEKRSGKFTLGEEKNPDTSESGRVKKESETKSDIIVKPDGSRVLLVTMNIGSMETTMSLEISKPTMLPNDCKTENDKTEINSENNERCLSENFVEETESGI